MPTDSWTRPNRRNWLAYTATAITMKSVMSRRAAYARCHASTTAAGESTDDCRVRVIVTSVVGLGFGSADRRTCRFTAGNGKAIAKAGDFERPRTEVSPEMGRKRLRSRV